MAIGTPTERKTASLTSQTATSAFSPATTIAAGTVAFLAACANANKSISSVTDSVGNTWAVDKTASDGTRTVNIASCQVATQITSSDTITITWSTATSGRCDLWVQEVTGLASSSVFDKSNSATASTGVLGTGSTGTLSQAAEIAWVVGRVDVATGWTKGAAWTNPTTASLNTFSCALEYQIVAATTALSGAGTWTGGVGAQVALIATYKGATAAAQTIPLGTAAATAATTAALSAQTAIPLGTAAAVAAPTLSASAQTQIPAGTSAATAAATLALSAPTTVPLGTSAATSSDSATVTAKTAIPLNTAAATSQATLSLSDETIVQLGSSAAHSSATLDLTAGTSVTTTPTRDLVSGWKPWLQTPEGEPFHAKIQPALVYARAFPARFTITYRASVATAELLIRAVAPTLGYDLTAELSRHHLRPVLARDTTTDQPDLLPLWLEEQKIAATREALLRTSLADATARTANLERQLHAVEAARDWNIVRADERAEIVDALMSHTQTRRAPAELPPDDIDREFARLLEDVLIACES